MLLGYFLLLTSLICWDKDLLPDSIFLSYHTCISISVSHHTCITIDCVCISVSHHTCIAIDCVCISLSHHTCISISVSHHQCIAIDCVCRVRRNHPQKGSDDNSTVTPDPCFWLHPISQHRFYIIPFPVSTSCVTC